MLAGLPHRLKTPLNERGWNVLVKQVTHRIHKNHSRLTPLQRKVHHVILKSDFKPVSVTRLAHGLKSHRHSLGIAELATGAHLVATGNRVPSSLGPFNGRIECHRFLRNESG